MLNKQLIILLFLFFIIGCDKKEADIKYIISKSFHQGIALEAIPEINNIIRNDTIYVFPCTDLYSFNKDKSLNDIIPYHVDKYLLKVVSDDFIVDTNKSSFYFLRISKKLIDQKIYINFAIDYGGKEASQIIKIDRGRLTLIFKNDNLGSLEEILPWRD